MAARLQRFASCIHECIDRGSTFPRPGVALDSNALVAEAGAEFRIAKDGVLRVSYSTQLGATFKDQSVRATVDLRF